MLKIAKSVEYALFAIKYIHEKPGEQFVSSKEISESMNIPFNLLAKILQKLVKHNIIISYQGTKGGYTLNSPPEQITLSDVVSALNQNIQLTDCLFDNATKLDCKRIDDCCLRSSVSVIQNKINDLFRSTTINQII